MRDFLDLEREYSRRSVSTEVASFTGSGFLSLAGQESQLQLVTDSLLPRDGEHGWFDLSLRDETNGGRIFIHNALLTSSRMPFGDHKTYHNQIFPNIVALDAQHLSPEGLADNVAFRLRDGAQFINHRIIEWQAISPTDAGIRTELRHLRTREGPYPIDYEFFSPSAMWIVHRLPRLLRFEIDEKLYQIFFLLHQRGFSGGHVELTAEPLFTVRFPEPVNLDEATDEVWRWRRFFSQITLSAAPFKSISAHEGSTPAARADIYLPNLREPTPNQFRAFGNWAGTMPFRRWSDRHALRRFMASWISRELGRRLFRSNLERVYISMTERTSIDNILALSAGLESIEELGGSSEFSSDDIDALVSGATDAASSRGLNVRPERLRGILGGLQRSNLRGRMERMSSDLRSLFSEEDFQMLIRNVQGLRNAAAHGGADLERLANRIAPATTALAAVSALWDQFTCGFDPATEGGHFNPLIIARYAIDELRQISRTV